LECRWLLAHFAMDLRPSASTMLLQYGEECAVEAPLSSRASRTALLNAVFTDETGLPLNSTKCFASGPEEIGTVGWRLFVFALPCLRR
jgi:hypothetical protein